MKVICIDGIDKYGVPVIEEGVPLYATQCPIHYDGFDILEYPTNSRGEVIAWKKSRFIPLSSKDETELIKQRESVLV